MTSGRLSRQTFFRCVPTMLAALFATPKASAPAQDPSESSNDSLGLIRRGVAMAREHCVIKNPPSIRAFVTANVDLYRSLSDAERASHREFFNGRQWDRITQSLRDSNHRPTLTINLLPGLLDRMIAEQHKIDPGYHVSGLDVEVCRVILARQLRDPQRLYNYFASAEAEALILRLQHA